MTVCIAALADNGKSIVLAVDRMLTSSNAAVPYQYEQNDVNKIFKITDNCFVLISGYISHAFAVLDSSKKKTGVNSKKSLRDILEILKREYDAYRESWLEEGILKPRGISSLKEYYSNHAKYQQNFAQTIDQQISASSFDVDLIVAGYENDGWHLYAIFKNLPIQDKNAEGFISIGSGGPHAAYAMIDLNYSKSLSIEQVEKIVRDAKVKSEKSPGVGKGINIEIYETNKKR